MVFWAVILITSVAGVTGRSEVNLQRSFPVGTIYNFSAEDVTIQDGFNIALNIEEQNHTNVRLEANKEVINIDEAFFLTSAMCKLIKRGVYAIFGSHTKNTFNTMKAYSWNSHVPFVTLGSAFSRGDPDASHVVYIYPDLSEALFRVLNMYKWKTVYYVYNSRQGLARMQSLLELLTRQGSSIRLVLLHVRDGSNAYDKLLDLDSEDDHDKPVILDLPVSQCLTIFQKETNITRSIQRHYLLAGLGIQEIKVPLIYKHGGMNITGFRIIDTEVDKTKDFANKMMGNYHYAQQEDQKITHWMALAADAASLINKALTRLFRSPREQGIRPNNNRNAYNNGSAGIDCFSERNMVPWKQGNDVINALKSTSFDGLTGRVAFDENGFRRDFKLGLLEVTKNRGLRKIGEWTNGRLALIHKPKYLVRQEDNNNDSSVQIVTSIFSDPFLMRKPGDHEGNAQYEGYCVDLLEKIAAKVGFKYSIVPVKDKKYGAPNNGTWDGMVGELVQHKAHIAIAPLTITSEREKVIDFSKPFMTLGISIMVKKMTKEPPGVFSFMFPLSYEIWMCVIFAYIGVSVVLFLVSRFSPYEWHIEDNTDGPTVTNNFTIFNSLWFSLGAFMQQGCDIEPRSMSGRIVGSVWWFFTLIIISSYTANLAAFLTLDRMSSPIESAEDLAKQTEIKYGTLKGGSTQDFFKTSTIEIYERMWAFMSADPTLFVDENKNGIQKVRSSKGKYAFLIESSTNEYTNQRKPCDTMRVGQNLDSKGYGIGTPLGSAYRDRISLAVLELLESGELEMLEKKWWIEMGECDRDGSDKHDTTSSLELSNVAGIFYILIAGLLLSLAMALLEFLYKSRTEARRRKTSFSTAVKSKAKLSMTGKPGQQTTSYTYAPAAQLISLDGYADANTHTQV